ncbi:unnamed protein product [Linum tenue]|uniref:Cytochrome P450 n=1 Tax=Linum tenue TaxID=586396 RepID=A0AAV0R8J6_9ROSI|nr:unnamed protein product [Linum tenue]
MDPKALPDLILFSFLTIFLFTFLLIIRRWIQKRRSKSSPPPPGPWRLPIIGHIHHLAGSTLPHRRLRALAQTHGPVMLLQLGEISHVVISSAEAAKQLRKLCTLELLSPKRVQSFRPIREEEGSKFVRRIAAAGGVGVGVPVNLSRLIFSLTYGVTSRIAFGTVREEQQDDEYIPVVEEIMAAAAGFGVADLFPSVKLLERVSGMKAKLERLHGVQDKLLEKIIAEHRARRSTAGENRGAEQSVENAEDLVDALLNLQRDGDHLGFSLTNDNIKAVIGSETSSTTVEWAISELIRNPAVMKKAQEEVRRVFGEKGRVDEAGLNELKYLKLVIKETLRLHTPAPLLVPRESREECEVGGYQIPVKATVLVNAWAIARDPSSWDEPEEFRPERFLDGMVDYKGNNFEYLPFGAGRRMCPGIVFGIANTELPLANMLFYFDWRLPSGLKVENLDMDESFGVTVRRKNDLEVIPIICHYPSTIS